MNPIHWLFAHIYRYIHILRPGATEAQLPVATYFALDMFLLVPVIQAVMVIEDVFNVNIGTLGTVFIWLVTGAVTYVMLLDEHTVARVLSRYPVKPVSTGQAKAFFGALVLLTLLMSFFPIASLLK